MQFLAIIRIYFYILSIKYIYLLHLFWQYCTYSGPTFSSNSSLFRSCTQLNFFWKEEKLAENYIYNKMQVDNELGSMV